MASGLISPHSLQGQFATRYFEGNTQEIDSRLDTSLQGLESEQINRSFGKNRQYAVGTVAHVSSHGNDYYLLAMSCFNDQMNAFSTPEMIDAALKGLWAYIRSQGEFQEISVPLLGTGRGRIVIPRKKMIEKIAQSFVDASRDGQFSNKLTIYIHPSDAESFEVNLFEVRDYLYQSLHA
jgi:hypothetical protein